MNFLNQTNQTHLALESVKLLSKKIHKYPKYIRKPLVKHSHGILMNISFAEDSISTCDLHSNAESFSLSEEEKTEDLSIKVRL